MSEKKEKTTAEVETKETKKSKSEAPKKKKEKKENKVKKFFKDFKGECKKITWPTGKTVVNSSLVVIAVVLIVGLVIFGFDTILSAILNALKDLAENREAAQKAAETTTAVATTAAQQMINMFFMK